MLEALEVSGFKKYRRLSLSGLGRINCILGSNNIGKTSILEAVYVWACGEVTREMFTDGQETMTLDGVYDGVHRTSTHTIGAEKSGAVCSAKFVGRDTLEDIYHALTGEAVDVMRRVFPDIAGLSPEGILRTDGVRLPVSSFGDGVRKWLCVIGAVMTCHDAIICIDEADTGLHHSAYPEYCKTLIDCARKNNLQIFMTTHNLEFIDDFLEIAYDDEGIKIITLREKKGIVIARTLNAREAMNARDNFSMELR